MYVRNKVFKSFIILTVSLLSSCASVWNNAVHEVTIIKGEGIRSVTVDSAQYISSGDKLHLLRSSENLKLKVQTDSTTKIVEIEPHSSFAYWLNIPVTIWAGLLLERNNPKRYAYPEKIHLELQDSTIIITDFNPKPKGTVNLVFSLPHFNSFIVMGDDTLRKRGGFWGLEAGLEYYYQRNTFVSVLGGAAMNFFLPVPAAVDIWGEQERSTTVFASIRNNHVFANVNAGYGFHFSSLTWKKSYLGGDPVLDSLFKEKPFVPKRIQNYVIGPSLSLQYRFSDKFEMGALYQPALITLRSQPQYNYQHFASLEFIWKVPINSDSK